jgi:molecular chaperone DnaK (HSP70)
MAVSKKNFYLGIDLGTTNSLMSWGKVDLKTKQVEAKLVPITMTSIGSGIVKKEILPSFVYFRENEVPIVGEYAKAMLVRQSSRVVKSVKNYMGTTKTFNFDGREWKPEEIASLVLRQIKISAKDFFGFEPDDVVITVPASFDTDMRAATIRAAQLAGFKCTEDDGATRDILLDEPRAALYDFINRQNREEIPSSLIDFNEPRNVLVFDLGGGTLDVSFHTAFFNHEKNRVDVDDIAISRYTRIGGDDFDNLLADRFVEKFRKKVDIDSLNEIEKEMLRAKFVSFAEQIKVELTSEIENKRFFGKPVENVTVNLLRGNVWDNRTFEYDLSKREYDEIISPLLGENFTLADVDKFGHIDYSKAENVIYPILDVLHKAKRKLGGIMPQVHAVLLNGGMTKVHAVRERLATFFGIEPLTLGDPDKAVARGATSYHYLLHKEPGFKPKIVTSETIGIRTVGKTVQHLVPAGTVLPYKSPIIKGFRVFYENIDYFDLIFYRGERKDIEPPNKELLKRRIYFARPLRKGEEIAIIVKVSRDKVLSFEGWLKDDPTKTKFTVEVVTDKK